MIVRDWWKRRFGNRFGASIRQDDFEHCTACGQAFNSRDLDQALSHFEHRLALAPRPLKESFAAEDPRSPGGKVVPFRRPTPDVVANVPSRGRAS
jgi:hypothetical protein